MDKIMTFIVFEILGIYIILYPTLTSSGGDLDLSYMNINIFLGFFLISLGVLYLKSKKSTTDNSSNGGTTITPGDSQSMESSSIDSSVDCGGGDGC